jgi:hypothetical protein
MSTVLTDNSSRLPVGSAAIKVRFDFFDKAPAEGRRRPRTARVATPLKVVWSWGPVEQEGVLRNISVGGCFIETVDEVCLGDRIQFHLSVPGLLHMQMGGMVIRRRQREGFALRFTKLSATEQALLGRAVRHLQARGSA